MSKKKAILLGRKKKTLEFIRKHNILENKLNTLGNI